MERRATGPDGEELRRHAEAFFGHRRLEALADYARHGRRFAPLPAGWVRRLWTESFRRWARNVCDRAEKERLDDLAAELALRGEAEPVARVGAAWDVAWREVEALLDDRVRRRRFVAAVALEYKDWLAAVSAAKQRMS